jgi:hypothetical protein
MLRRAVGEVGRDAGGGDGVDAVDEVVLLARQN